MYKRQIQLIDIFAKRGGSDEAWTYLDLNFDCKPYRLSDLGKRAKFTLQDFKEGFRHEMLYNHYRSFMSLKDHCIVLHNQGLYPDMNMLRALDVLLMVPFGYTFEQMRETKGTSDVLKAFETAWHFMKPLFPVFSVNWISKSKPCLLYTSRNEFVGDAKAVVVGMTSNGFTLADPNDRRMLDVVGFDTTAPAVIADFVRGS